MGKLDKLKRFAGFALEGVAIAGAQFRVPEVLTGLARRGADALKGRAKEDQQVGAWFKRVEEQYQVELTTNDRRRLEPAIRGYFAATATLQNALGAVLLELLDDEPVEQREPVD